MSTEARDVIRDTLSMYRGQWLDMQADAVVAALEAAGLTVVPRTDVVSRQAVFDLADEWERDARAMSDPEQLGAARELRTLAGQTGPRIDDWEWGLYCAEDNVYVDRDDQRHAQMSADEDFTVVRRHPAGEWEPAP